MKCDSWNAVRYKIVKQVNLDWAAVWFQDYDHDDDSANLTLMYIV